MAERLMTDGELCRFMAARMVDTIDTLGELARTSTVTVPARRLVVDRFGTEVQRSGNGRSGGRAHRSLRPRARGTRFGPNVWQLGVARERAVFVPMESARRRCSSIRTSAHTAGARARVPPFRWLDERRTFASTVTSGSTTRSGSQRTSRRSRRFHPVRLLVDGEQLARGPRRSGRRDRARRRRVVPRLVRSLSPAVVGVGVLAPADDTKAVKLLEFAWDEVP